MNQSDVSSLPGLVLHVLIISVATTYPLSLVLLWRYRRTVEALAQQKTGTSAVGEEPSSAVPTAFEGTADELYTELRHAPRRSATLQGLAGAVVACCLAALFLASGGVPPTFPRMAFVAVTLFWPGVLAIVLTMGMSRRQRLAHLSDGWTRVLPLGVAASVATPGEALLEAAFFSGVFNVPATGRAGASPDAARSCGRVLRVPCHHRLGQRRGRGAGALAESTRSCAAGRASSDHRPRPRALGRRCLVAALRVSRGRSVWGVAVQEARPRVAHNRVGDEGITLSAMWLVYTGAFAALMLFFRGNGPRCDPRLGELSPFYLALTWSGRRLFLSVPSGPGPMLLLLRVFSSKGPTPQLFHTVSRHWRHVGPIAIIGWKDLASAAIEPNEFMAFLRRQAKDRS